MLDLRPFQKRFIREAFRPGIDTSALSIPSGNGKSALASHLLERCLTPGDSMHESGAEYLLGAGSNRTGETLLPSHHVRPLNLAGNTAS